MELQHGSARLAAGDHRAAIASAKLVLAAAPQQADAWVLLGEAMCRNDPTEAIACWRRALQHAPQHARAQLLLAEQLEPQRATPHAEAAARLSPRSARAWLALARTRAAQALCIPAGTAIERMLTCVCSEAELTAAALLAIDLRLLDLATRCADAAVRLHPTGGGPLALLVELHARQAEWGRLADTVARFLTATPDAISGPMDAAQSSDDPTFIRRFAESQAGSVQVPAEPRPPAAKAGDQITIAYCSPDLREHPVAHMLQPVVAAHNRTRARILTVGLREPATSGPGARVRAASDGYLDVSGLDDGSAASRLQAAGIDVLIDCAGATPGNRYALLARRPVAKQILWLGCPTGTGAPWYDGILLDGVACPHGAEIGFREPVIRLPLCHHPITAGAVPPKPTDRGSLGLDSHAVLIACLHSLHKLRPDTVDRWLAIAASCPPAVLWLDIPDPAAQERVRTYAAARGVGPRQIAFRPFAADRGDYLGQLALADLFLDNHPYGAHSTAGEALAMGVPVVTPAGRSVAARIASSMLHDLGLEELICDGMYAWEARIRTLVCDAAERQAIKAKVMAAAPRIASHAERLAEAIESAARGLISAP